MTTGIKISRRTLVEFLGGGAAYAAAGPVLATPAPSMQALQPLAPTTADAFALSQGFRYNIIARFGDVINAAGERFGGDPDFTAALPLGKNESLLWVNHETCLPLFGSGWHEGQKRTREQVDLEQLAIGGSILKIRRAHEQAPWQMVPNDPLNRRLSAQTVIPFVSDEPIAGSMTAIGTLGNCCGGVTPWGTVLTCEENYQEYYGEYDAQAALAGKKQRVLNQKGLVSDFAWEAFYDRPPEHYGWVVEVDVHTGKARKHTALGRFAHEGARVVALKDGRVAVYMGDDTADQCLYKFISAAPGSLDRGTLYVADLVQGRWLPLNVHSDPRLKSVFRSQTQLLTYARLAAKIVGGTPLNRPEGIAIHPQTNAVIVSLTMNPKKGDHFGSLLKLNEAGGDHGALSFQTERLLAGGPETGFANPDNLIFDPKGNLWLCCDVSEKQMHKDPYTAFANNSLWYIPMTGDNAGRPVRIANAPTDAELTGISWHPDGKTLLLSVQHPGNSSKSLDKLTSHWPHDGGTIPRGAVVAITGGLLDRLVSA